MRPKEILRKIQEQPESTRRLIAWTLTVMVGLALLSWWIPRVGERLKTLQEAGIPEELFLPKAELKERLGDFPFESSEQNFNGKQ